MLGLSEAAEKLGFRSLGLRLTIEQLPEISLPCILHWKQNHFVILYRIKNNRYFIADPGIGKVNLSEKEFTDNWYPDNDQRYGLVLILSPRPEFYSQQGDDDNAMKWKTILLYFYEYRKLFVQLILGVIIGSSLQLVTPFLTQSVVDIGINTNNLNFIYLVLIAQLMLFIGQSSITFIRSWILLHISTRINISILTDLLIKLMKLPMEFFSTKTTGDIMQRMQDQERIETFLTSSTLNTLFSFVNLVVFGIVLAFYHLGIFVVFAASSVLYTGWILLFMKRRRELDYRNFTIASDNQTNVVEIVSSIQEIKLNNFERQKRWSWENIQARLFRFKVKSLALSQYQESGAMAIEQLKNILIIFISARAVIDGELSLGTMMAIQYIVGMVSNPIQQLLGFIHYYQDAKISLERINEIYQEPDEEPAENDLLTQLPHDRSITFKSVIFRYPGAGNEPVLSDIDLVFPGGKTTAIVGMSGSGKTTVLKLILRFFMPEKGELYVGNIKQKNISFSTWRNDCGVVMQDGFIFADTIENNIIVGKEPDRERLELALKIANLTEFIDEQPFGLKTRIGIAGKGISQGQRQRILIARAVYKDPHYIILDEATNSLDAKNERIIIENLKNFFENRTVIIVAHRLSTVSYADNIVVLSNGRVIEQGTHQDLVNKRGQYYNLVRNQLELGN